MAYYKLTMNFAMPSQQLAQNVFVASSTVPWSFPANGNTIAAWLMGLWQTYIRPYMPGAQKLVAILIHEYVVGEGWVARHEVSYNLAGTGTGEALPPQVAQLITFGGGSMGRRGKKYIPATTEAWCNNGALISTFLTSLANFGVSLANVTSVSGVFCKMGFATMTGDVLTLFHPYNGFVRVPVYTVTQRRRRLGSGS